MISFGSRVEMFVDGYLIDKNDTFFLNYSTAAYGDVKIGAFAADGMLLGETDLLHGNDLSRPVTFDGIAGREGYLRFDLRDAHVCAIGSEMVKSDI